MTVRTRSTNILVLTLFSLLLVYFPTFRPASAADIYYVDISVADDQGTGLTWTDAFKYLDQAMLIAGDDDRIHVAQGTYFPGQSDAFPNGETDRTKFFLINAGVSLLGGHQGGSTNPGDWDPVAFPTIIDGNIGSAIDASDNSEHIFQTEDVTTGNAIQFHGVTLQNATNDTVESGGAIRVRSASVDIHLATCQFLDSFASNRGAAMSSSSGLDMGTWRVDNCVFARNVSVERGGALHCADGTSDDDEPLVYVRNSSFYSNKSARGGAISTGEKVGIYISNCNFFDNSVVESQSLTPGGAAIRFHPQVSSSSNERDLLIYNSVFYRNYLDDQGVLDYDEQIWVQDLTAQYHAEVDHCLVDKLSSLAFTYAGSGNIDNNPRFADLCSASGPDLRLLPGSPLIDAGADQWIAGDQPTATRDLLDVDNDLNLNEDPPDLEFSVRIGGTSIDIGPYEGTISPGFCPSDLNDDCIVDVFDLLILLAAWGTTEYPGGLGVPYNTTDTVDLLILLADWGDCLTGGGELVPKTIQDCLDKYGYGTPEAEACIQALQLSGSGG